MSDHEDVASQLAGLCPELAIDWEVNGSDLDLSYVALGHLASRLVEVRELYPNADFGRLFDDVEIRLAAAQPGIRNLIIVGFLEALQNVDRERATRWESLFGPETREAWVALNYVWAGRISPEVFNHIVG
jgi:hypothetical protein